MCAYKHYLKFREHIVHVFPLLLTYHASHFYEYFQVSEDIVCFQFWWHIVDVAFNSLMICHVFMLNFKAMSCITCGCGQF